MHRFAILLALALASFAVGAQQSSQDERIVDIESFPAQQQEIRADMAGAKKFKHVTDYDKRRLYAAQDQIPRPPEILRHLSTGPEPFPHFGW